MNNFAFLTACRDYKDNLYQKLIGIESDTSNMKIAMSKYCGCKDENIVLCTQERESDYKPGFSGIFQMIKEEGEKHENESFRNVFFYFSGHGTIDENKTVKLIPSDSVPGSPSESIAVNEIANSLRTYFPFAQIVLFIDVCQRPITAKGYSDNMDDSVSYPQGVVVFYSCSPNSESYMIPASYGTKYREGSIFTYCLAKALDFDSQCCTVHEISDYIKKTIQIVCQDIGVEQIPHTSMDDDTLANVEITCRNEMLKIQEPTTYPPKHRAEVEEVFDRIVANHPEVKEYSFVRDIHSSIFPRINDPNFIDEMKLILASDIQMIKTGQVSGYKKQRISKRAFTIYYCLGMYYKRNTKHLGPENTLESIVKEYDRYFEDYILHLEVLSWYYRRAASMADCDIYQKKEYYKKAYENDKKMISNLDLEVNAGVYASFASTVGRSLEAFYETGKAEVLPWENDAQCEEDWELACKYFEGEKGIIEMYKKVWRTKTDYGKHQYLMGKLLMYRPHFERLSCDDQIKILKKAKAGFQRAQMAESESTKGIELLKRDRRYSEYIAKCDGRIDDLKHQRMRSIGSGTEIIRVTEKCKKNQREGLRKPNEDQLLGNQELGLFIIADGVTRPHEEYKDEYSERYAASDFAHTLCQSLDRSISSQIEKVRENPEEKLRSILVNCNNRFKSLRAKYLKMGTYPVCSTLLLAFIHNGKLYYYNCCDTVGYILRNGLKIQFTEYYNWVSDTRKNNKKDVYDIIQNNIEHPDGFGIFNGGKGFEDFVRIGNIRLESGDRIILASDGLAAYLKGTRGRDLEELTAEAMIENSKPFDAPPFSKYADDKACLVIDIQ